ncbi:MAG: four helix bundle protein [Planctomycetota bacterium]
MPFQVLDLSLAVIRHLSRPLERVRRSDPKLYDQIRRAASSVALNLSEGRHRQGKDRQHLFRVAAGSASELRTALQVAQAWGELDLNAVRVALVLLDRVAAMLWRLTH